MIYIIFIIIIKNLKLFYKNNKFFIKINMININYIFKNKKQVNILQYFLIFEYYLKNHYYKYIYLIKKKIAYFDYNKFLFY